MESASAILADLSDSVAPTDRAVIMLMERVDALERKAEEEAVWRARVLGAGPELAALLKPMASSSTDAAERARLWGAVTALAPDDAEAHVEHADAFMQLKDANEMLISVDKALALAPDNAEALGGRASALIVLERFADAIAAIDKLLAAKPDDAETKQMRVYVHLNIHRLTDALNEADALLTANPRDARTHAMRSGALLELGRFEEALVAGRCRTQTLSVYAPQRRNLLTPSRPLTFPSHQQPTARLRWGTTSIAPPIASCSVAAGRCTSSVATRTHSMRPQRR
jgi:tetratricopeptide (TPR) repeat protein